MAKMQRRLNGYPVGAANDRQAFLRGLDSSLPVRVR